MKYLDKQEKKVIRMAKKQSKDAEKLMKKGNFVENTERKKQLQQAAKEYFDNETKSNSISLRIAPSDLAGIKEIAAKKGLPYQTLIGSILHQYINREHTAS